MSDPIAWKQEVDKDDTLNSLYWADKGVPSSLHIKQIRESSASCESKYCAIKAKRRNLMLIVLGKVLNMYGLYGKTPLYATHVKLTCISWRSFVQRCAIWFGRIPSCFWHQECLLSNTPNWVLVFWSTNSRKYQDRGRKSVNLSKAFIYIHIYACMHRGTKARKIPTVFRKQSPQDASTSSMAQVWHSSDKASGKALRVTLPNMAGAYCLGVWDILWNAEEDHTKSIRKKSKYMHCTACTEY